MKKSLVMFSGGLDSFLSLYTAIKDGGSVSPIFFNYGQNSFEVEKKVVEKISADFNLTPIILDISTLSWLMECDYTDGFNPVEGETYNSNVPNRNLLLSTLAYNYAMANGFAYVYTGFYFKNHRNRGNIMNRIENRLETVVTPPLDQSNEFLIALSNILYLSNPDSPVQMVHCLRNFDKVDILRELRRTQYFDYAIETTVSCYASEEKLEENVWGKGCGICASCITRKEAYQLM